MGRKFFASSPIRIPPSAVPVNAPPINTVPTAQTTYVSTTKLFSEAGSNPVKLVDVDTPMVTVTVTATNGTIELVPNQKVVVSNNVSSKVVVVGSITNVNLALNGMKFAPTPAFSGTAVITVRSTDGYNVDTDSFNVVVSGTAPVYVPPGPVNTIATVTRTTTSGTGYSFAGNSPPTVFDPDVPNLTTYVGIPGPAYGTISVSNAGGATVTNNNSTQPTIAGTQAQINTALASMVYYPLSNYSGTAKLTMTTTNGTLQDVDYIYVEVRPPVFPPTHSVPASLVVQVSSPARLRGFPDNSEFRVATAYKSPIQVTLKATKGTIRSEMTPTGPNALADGFPPKVIYGYWDSYGTQGIKGITINYTVIGLLSVRNSGDGTDNGAMSWVWATNPAAIDLQTVRARGQKVLLVIGGVGYSFLYQTRQQSMNLLNSIIPIINGLGGVDGIDFQNYNGTLTGLSLSTEAIFIAQQLKAQYGSSFAIVLSLRQDLAQAAVRTLAADMAAANCLTWVQCLFLNASVNKTANVVSDKVISFAQGTPMIGEKILIGFSANYDYVNNLTQAEVEREWDRALANIIGLRGVSCYNTELDAAASNTFSLNFRNTKMGTAATWGGASATGYATNNFVVTGNLTQVNDIVTWMYYTGSATGIDPVTMTTTDGTSTVASTTNISVNP